MEDDPRFLSSIHLKGILSFGPESPEIPLTALNVLIGPNASGKSNLIEAFELLRATPINLAEVMRQGGGVAEWIWKGERDVLDPRSARMTAVLARKRTRSALRYSLAFAEAFSRLQVVEEVLEEAKPPGGEDDEVDVYYRFREGRATIKVPVSAGARERVNRQLAPDSLDPRQSIFSQRRDPDQYPELTYVGTTLSRILSFREWSFGRTAMLRQQQPADLPDDVLLPDLRNLGLALNRIEHGDRWSELNAYLHRFLPRFKRLTTRVKEGRVQIYLHEDGLKAPVPATRLSDGTIRFVALLAILLQPELAPLVCLEEPELGLHPDAMALIAELLIEASAKTQLIVTTHSDALVSSLTEHAESVVVADWLPSGTVLRRLDSEKLRFWLDKYNLGEIWRIGKVGGNP